MADLADQAAEAEQMYRDQALARHRDIVAAARTLEAAENCMDCGGMIPSMRQAAVPGTQCCTGCAEIREKAAARFR